MEGSPQLGAALLMKRGDVYRAPQSVGGPGRLPPFGLQRTEQYPLLIIYLPGDSLLQSGDLGWGGGQPVPLIGIFPRILE